MRRLATFLLPVLLLEAQPAEEPRGSISGRCVSAQTGDPLKGASIEIATVFQGHFWHQATLSAADGTFSFEHLSPGAYHFTVEKSGYRLAQNRPVVLEKNQSRTGLEIKMTRAAVITGRVTDPDGLPMIGAEVAAYLFTWESGRRNLSRANSAATDDRGVYRLFGLPAGRYLIGASAPPEEGLPGEVDLNAARVYYPNAATPAEAVALEARWGQELAEINLVLGRQRTFSISGVVADAESGGPCRSCTVRAAGLSEGWGFSHQQSTVAPDGSYRLRGLAPGGYRILALKPAGGRHIFASRTLYIADRDLRDAHLVVGVGHTVRGRVVLESPPAETPAANLLIQFSVEGEKGQSEFARVSPDLSFEIPGLSAITYRVSLRGVPPGGYLKVVRLAGRDLPAPQIDVPAEGALEQLELVVAFDSASLSGRVKLPETADRGHRITGAIVGLFPQENQSPFLVEQIVGTAAASPWPASPRRLHRLCFPPRRESGVARSRSPQAPPELR